MAEKTNRRIVARMVKIFTEDNIGLENLLAANRGHVLTVTMHNEKRICLEVALSAAETADGRHYACFVWTIVDGVRLVDKQGTVEDTHRLLNSYGVPNASVELADYAVRLGTKGEDIPSVDRDADRIVTMAMAVRDDEGLLDPFRNQHVLWQYNETLRLSVSFDSREADTCSYVRFYCGFVRENGHLFAAEQPLTKAIKEWMVKEVKFGTAPHVILLDKGYALPNTIAVGFTGRKRVYGTEEDLECKRGRTTVEGDHDYASSD